MNRSYSLNIKTRKGKVMKVVRELYLRDSMSCHSEACDFCVADYPGMITLSSTPYNNQYLMPDSDVLVNQIDLFQQDIPPFCDVIILQSVLLEVRTRSISAFNQLSSLIRNQSKRFIFFANQNFESTYLDRKMDESEADYNMHCIITANQYYRDHLKPYNLNVVIVTNNKLLESKYKENENVSIITIASFLDSISKAYPGIVDHLNIASIEKADNSPAEMEIDQSTEEGIYDSKKQMYILSKERGDNIYYPNYLPDSILEEGLKAGRLFKGVYHANQDNITEGHVIVHTSENEYNVLIKGREDINRVIDGDVVVIEMYPQKQWKAESDLLITNDNDDGETPTNQNETPTNGVLSGRVVGVLKRNWRMYCGSLEIVEDGIAVNYYLFDPVNRRIPKIRIKTSQYSKLMNKRILVAVNDWPVTSNYPIGHYIKTLGDIGDRETETQVILLEHDIPPNTFSREVMECLPPDDWYISEENSQGREDLRGKVCIVSIDPPGCKDIDDALHARDLPNGNIEVGIHIADVTYYMKHNSALDKEARNRSTSTYLVDRRLDMLPKLLTEKLCSLVGGEDRFAFSVIAEMNHDGDVITRRFVKTIIRSKKAMSYGEAQEYLDKHDDTSEIGHGIHLLYHLSKKLKAKRIAAGALTLSSPEVRFEMDDEKQDPLSMDSYKHKETNSLVEEFMLLANCLVARRITDAYPKLAILRRHPVPDKSRFEHLIKVAHHAGFELNCDSNKELADSLDRAVLENHPYFNKLLRILTTRCMTQAVYFPAGDVQPELFYHYGLAAPIYTHFTSPIRRYADDMVHRLLAAAEGYIPLPEEYKGKDFMKNATDIMNTRHYNAQMAGRDSVELFTVIFFNNKNEKATGVVMNCKKNGIKVWVPKYGIEGMIFINNTSKKNQLNHNYNNDFDYDNETSVLTNIHDPQDTIETFQPITVGIHVQEMKGFRKELILSILSSHAFDEETEEEKKEMNEKKEKKEKKEVSEKKEKKEKKEVSEKKEKKEKKETNLKREKKRKEEKVEKRRKVE